MYNTDAGMHCYKLTGGVPQGSVLGPLLWNAMYKQFLKKARLGKMSTVALAGDEVLVAVMKNIKE